MPGLHFAASSAEMILSELVRKVKTRFKQYQFIIHTNPLQIIIHNCRLALFLAETHIFDSHECESENREAQEEGLAVQIELSSCMESSQVSAVQPKKSTETLLM